MNIRLSDYYNGNFMNFRGSANEQNLKQGLEDKKEDIVRYLEEGLLRVYPSPLMEQFIRDTKIEFSDEIKVHKYAAKYKKFIARKLGEALSEICNSECPLNDLVRRLIDALNGMNVREFAHEDFEYNNPRNRWRDEEDRPRGGWNEINELIEMIERHACECNQIRYQNDRCNCPYGNNNNEEFCCGRKIMDIIDKYLRGGGCMLQYTAGEYSLENNKITLYLNVIKMSSSDDFIESVFAHELFHAYHMYSMMLAGSIWVNNPEYHCAVVLESLAACFEYWYTKDEMMNDATCNERYKSWEEYDVDFWPYAGAKGIVDMTEASQKPGVKIADPFVLIFADSHEKMEDKAYEDIRAALRYSNTEPFGKMRQIQNRYIDPKDRVHTYAKVSFGGRGGEYDYLCDGQDVETGKEYVVPGFNGEGVAVVRNIHREKGRNMQFHFSKYKSVLRKAASSRLN